MRRCSGQCRWQHVAPPLMGATILTAAARACAGGPAQRDDAPPKYDTTTSEGVGAPSVPGAAGGGGGDRVVLNRLLAQLRRNTPLDGAHIKDPHVRVPPASASSMDDANVVTRPSGGAGPTTGRRRDFPQQANARQRLHRQGHSAIINNAQPPRLRSGVQQPPHAGQSSQPSPTEREQQSVSHRHNASTTDNPRRPRRVYNPLASMTLPPRQPQDLSLLAKHPQYTALRGRCATAFQELGSRRYDDGDEAMRSTLASGDGSAAGDAAPSAFCYASCVLECCVRPLLALTGFAFDVDEMVQHFLPFLEAAPLQRSLSRHGAAVHIFVFVNPIDGSTMAIDLARETFFRRFYPTIHLSWEPVEVVARRLGFAANHVPRDILVAFLMQFASPSPSQQEPLIELAILCRAATNLLVAEPLVSSNSVGSAEKLSLDKEAVVVVRRIHSDRTPLSVVETVRMVGAPATAYPRKKTTSAHQQPHNGNGGGGASPRGGAAMAIHTMGVNLQFSASTLAAAAQLPPTGALGDHDGRQYLSQAAKKAVPLEQATRSRINEFSVPSRFLEGSRPQGHDMQASPHRQQHNHRQQQFASTQQSASGKDIHNIKVRIVTLKQRAKMASGSERLKLLEELGVARAKLLQLVPAAAPVPATASVSVPAAAVSVAEAPQASDPSMDEGGVSGGTPSVDHKTSDATAVEPGASPDATSADGGPALHEATEEVFPDAAVDNGPTAVEGVVDDAVESVSEAVSEASIGDPVRQEEATAKKPPKRKAGPRKESTTKSKKRTTASDDENRSKKKTKRKGKASTKRNASQAES